MEQGTISVLNRATLVLLIEEIVVEENQHIKVRFRYADQYERSIQLLTQLSKTSKVLGANIRKQILKGGEPSYGKN